MLGALLKVPLGGERSFAYLTCVQIGAYEILYNLLLGNLPGAYYAMRKVLEGAVDITISYLKFPNKNLYDSMKKIRQRYHKFGKKCKFLRSHCGAETMEKARELWELTSNWIHAGSLAKKFVEKIIEKVGGEGETHILPFPGSLAIPHDYDSDDVEELRELQKHLQTLRSIHSKIFQAVTRKEEDQR